MSCYHCHCLSEGRRNRGRRRPVDRSGAWLERIVCIHMDGWQDTPCLADIEIFLVDRRRLESSLRSRPRSCDNSSR